MPIIKKHQNNTQDIDLIVFNFYIFRYQLYKYLFFQQICWNKDSKQKPQSNKILININKLLAFILQVHEDDYPI